MPIVSVKNLEEKLDEVIERLERQELPAQQKDNNLKELDIVYAILEELKRYLRGEMDLIVFDGEILKKEDYDKFRDFYQKQKSLIVATFYEIMRYLNAQELDIAKILRTKKSIEYVQFDKEIFALDCSGNRSPIPKASSEDAFYVKDYNQYQEWLKTTASIYPEYFYYSLINDLDYETYRHIAILNEEEETAWLEYVTPEKFVHLKDLEIDKYLVTEFATPKYLKNLSNKQISEERLYLKYLLNSQPDDRIQMAEQNVIEEYTRRMKKTRRTIE